MNSSSCPYYYLQQPPENPFCDPFGAFDLELKCKVCAELATDFSVGWQRDNESLTQDMAIIDNSQAVSNDSSGNVVQCVESRLKIRGAFLSKHYGNYFCRIVQGVHHRNLQPSRSIQLTSAAGQRCVSGMTFVDNLYSCAVITSPSTVDASVTNRTPASSGKKYLCLECRLG